NGYTAASPIKDEPFKPDSWNPRNWYSGHRGIQSLRRSVEQSINTNSAKTLEDIVIQTSMAYLEKMGIIDKENSEKDNFITKEENPNHNDENLPSLALGGMTRGLTPLEVTGAFGAIANYGVYVDSIAFTKVLDKDGNVLIDNTPKETTIVSPQIAYIMKDILHSTVNNGLATAARIPNMAVAGKTGTTNDQADVWFSGFTPYYVSSVWIGNDSPKIQLNQGSGLAARFWQYSMTKIHNGLDGINSFSKPDGITSAKVCSKSGLLANRYCARASDASVISEIFAQGTVPTKHCDIHTGKSVKPPKSDKDKDKNKDKNKDKDKDKDDKEENEEDENDSDKKDENNNENSNNNNDATVPDSND